MRLGLALDLLRAEGLRGIGGRLADRIASLRDRAAETSVRAEELAGLLARAGGAPVLDVLATPREPRFGGVAVQFQARLPEERRLRPTAVLSPERGGWTLAASSGGMRWRCRIAPARTGGFPKTAPIGAEEAIRDAARIVAARVVNVEGAAGWPPDALLALAAGPAALVLSLHDFALYCPRPNLVEEPAARFCGYSAGGSRCAACLAAAWRLPPRFVEAWREASRELLSSAHAVVYPSDFLRRAHAELFPGATPRREAVIAPASPGGPAAPPRPPGERVSSSGSPRVAFVGAYRPHKGALVFEELVRRGGRVDGRPVRWTVLGSGDPGLVRRAREDGVRVVGHYPAGALPRLLAAEQVDVALLLSIWPETFSLTLTECRIVGVPVIAFEHGAIAERIRNEGGGRLVPLERGAEGIALALEALLAGADPSGCAPFRPEAVPEASRAARERSDLYRTLLPGTP